MRTPWAKGGERSSDANNANFILAYPRAITIDYVYKTENKFNWQDATTHVVWDGVKGMNFSKGLDERGQDLNLESKEGAPFFRHFFVRSGGGHGHYDLGEVSFDSVKEIDEAKADALQDTPCVLNHVYGVRTYEGKYAKFVVRKIVAIHPR